MHSHKTKRVKIIKSGERAWYRNNIGDVFTISTKIHPGGKYDDYYRVHRKSSLYCIFCKDVIDYGRMEKIEKIKQRIKEKI